MKVAQVNKLKKIAAVILVAQITLALFGNAAYAAVTDLTDIPLAAYSNVKPNIMYTLDNSGSMHWSTVTGYDGLGEYTSGARNTHAYYASAYNQLYYDPAITYAPAVNYLGATLGNAPPAAAPLDPFPTTGKTNGVVNLTERCNAAATPVLPSYNLASTPYVTAMSANNTNCAASTTGTRARYAFYYSPSATAVLRTSLPLDINFPLANRVDIIPSTATYPRAATRIDCVTTPSASAPTQCSYQEEIQNFANWFTYYRTRINMTKSSLGRVFAGLEDRFRVGFNTINAGSDYDNQTAPGTDTDYWQNVRDFNLAQKQAWFDKLYKVYPGQGTPLRNQMQKIGRYYSGELTPLGAPDPVQYSCQSNYHIMSTDGFWNKDEATPSSPTVGNQDGNQADTYSTITSASYDVNNASNTLADVAMYYYKNDLRTTAKGNCTGILGIDVCTNNVKTNRKDKATHQHMSVFTIGLGASGQNPYFDDYEIRSDIAYAGKGYDPTFWMSKLKAGMGGASDSWPIPKGDESTTIDDLWHAAVNARGTYLNAGDPATLTKGLTKILNEIAAREASSAGAALTSNDFRASSADGAYSVVYDSGSWSGDVLGKSFVIDPTTGLPVTALVWNAQSLLDDLVRGTGWKDTRKVFTVGESAGPRPFVWDKLTNIQQAALGNKDVVEYLRGATNPIYRARKHVLGDIAGSEPVYVGAPDANYNEAENPGYETVFKVDYKGRKPMLYVGANDGMLHAFNAQVDLAKDPDGGKEVWAFVPSLVYQGPNNTPAVDGLAALTNPDYTHHFYVDAKPYVRDVDFARAGVNPKLIATGTYDWHTLLIGGLGKGGKGYFALDVTNPTNDNTNSEKTLADTKVLWEFKDPDMGYSYGEPLITKTRKWGWVVIVSSGYNNTTGPNPGQGFLYILNAKTGALLQKIGTGEGSAADPSGLTQFTGWTLSEGDWTGEQVYAGDLLGNLWRFDISQAASVAGDFPAPLKLAILSDGVNKQPVTTAPVISLASNNADRYVFVGTGKLLGSTDRTDAKTQSFYAIRDGGKNIPYLASTLPTGFSFPLQRTNFAQLLDPTVGVNTTGKLGWALDLGHDAGPTSPSERVIIKPTATNGTVVFASAIPTVLNACSANTKGSFYALSVAGGKTRLKDASGAALAKIDNPDGYTKVELVRIKGKMRAVATDGSGGITPVNDGTGNWNCPPGAVNCSGGLGPNAINGVPHRYYWREVLQ
jgi:type IV pilus assembly protein PilY1